MDWVREPLVWLIIAALGGIPGLYLLFQMGRWLWRHALLLSLAGPRKRYRAWKLERQKAREKATLDKVALLASREGDFKAVHPGCWPEPAKTVWRDAVIQMTERGIRWEVQFPEYGATVRCTAGVMTARWGRFWVLAGVDVMSSNYRTSGYYPNLYWAWPDACPHVATEGPVIDFSH